MLSTDQEALVNTAASAFGQVWTDQLFMQGEMTSEIGAEYLASTKIGTNLANAHPGRVKIEVPFTQLRSGFMRRNPTQPFPAKHLRGRVDVVVFEEQNALIPFCLIEVKRAALRLPIMKDAARIGDYLRSHRRLSHPRLFGFCVAPMILKPSSAGTYHSARARSRAALTRWGAFVAASYSALDVQVRFPSTGTRERPCYVEQEIGNGQTELIWDPNGFRAEIAVIALTYR